MFLSFSLKAFALESWYQYISFLFSHIHNCAVRAFLLATSTSLSDCASLKLSSTFNSDYSISILLSTSPKTSLFHFLMGAFNFFNFSAKGKHSIFFHSVSTSLTKVGFENHMSRDLKGLGPQFDFSQSTKIGL